MPSSCMCMSVKRISYMKNRIFCIYVICICYVYMVYVYICYISFCMDVLHPKPLVLVFKSIYITIVNMYFEYGLFKAKMSFL